MRNHRENGIALITALLVLLLVSSLIVGLTWLTISDQKLGSNYSGRQSDFYVAEGGLETLTANLAAQFNNNYNLSSADISNIMTTNLPVLPPGYTFWDPNNPGNNGYMISYTPDPSNGGNPASSYATVLTGPYSGLVALLTPYTLEVTAESPFGSETKLKRTVQTAAIPVFQFGMFSQTDLSFFAGPDFNFGGRAHTNGNMWLAENGGTLTMANKVTAVGEIIRTNLENGTSVNSGSYGTTVQITTNPGSACPGGCRALALTEGSTTGTSYYGNVSASENPNFTTIEGDYNGNLQNHVAPLDLGIATPSLGGQAIDLIRLPVVGEDSSNPNKLAERYYSQASVRILLSDYGSDGSCKDSDIMSLPEISAGYPVDLATLAWDATLGTNATNTGDSSVTPPPYKTAPTGALNTQNFSTFLAALAVSPETIFPLPVSDPHSSSAYNSKDGYWVQAGYPIESGCLKIDYQTMAGGAFTDVTWQILSQGYTGRNIEPLTGAGGAPKYATYPGPAGTLGSTGTPGSTKTTIPPLVTSPQNGQGPTISSAATVGCTDPSPNAIIRLARIRPNPTTATSANGYCGNTSTVAPSSYGEDYWPNVLFDSREGALRDEGTTGGNSGNPTLAGTMHYVELDVANLAAWLIKNAGVVNNTTGYTVYFSDRRGDQPDTQSPPPSTAGSASGKTGAYGFEDIVNSTSSPSAGCPDGKLEPAEDFEGDYNSSNVDIAPVLKTYGNLLYQTGGSYPSMLWPFYKSGNLIGTEVGTGSGTTEVSNFIKSVLGSNGQCSSTYGGIQWPYAVAANNSGLDLQENPPIFFRRALKLVDGANISIGTCDGVPCGLTVVAENPVYVQGDYNDGNLDPNFASTSPHVACAVIADAVTLLSDAWNDTNSFAFPYNSGDRVRATTMYRMAVAGGKGIPFKQPSGSAAADYGTDGGMHNFLRYLESGNNAVDYHGSVVSFYYSHQATGTYKDDWNNVVYQPPTRTYNFDTDFETPSLLPPRTPMLRTINTIGFTQVVLPTQ